MQFGFLLDMDGVVYRGKQVIPGAAEFIANLVKYDIPFLFLTNNSRRTPRDISVKLREMNMAVTEKNIFTSAMATADYLESQAPKGRAYVIGEGGLLNALHDVHYAIVDANPDYVVIGEGRTLTLDAVEKAVSMLHQGAKLIATNLDPYCPTSQGGIRPGCGAFVKMIEAASGKMAFSPGKPSPVMFRAARKRLNLGTDQTIMVGDTMDTDVLGAIQLNYKTILVLSGGTDIEDLDQYSYSPDLVIPSVASLNEECLKTIADGEGDFALACRAATGVAIR